MRRVITVNLAGNAFQLDEDAYERLRAYMSLTDSRLASNPDRAEILGDLERAVADHVVANRTDASSLVVSDGEVERALANVGTVEQTEAHAGSLGATPASPRAVHGSWERPGESEFTRLPVLLLCFFVGWLGIHRFFVGKIGTGVLMLFTLGGLGIWVVVDLILIIFGEFKDRDGHKILRWG